MSCESLAIGRQISDNPHRFDWQDTPKRGRDAPASGLIRPPEGYAKRLPLLDFFFDAATIHGGRMPPLQALTTVTMLSFKRTQERNDLPSEHLIPRFQRTGDAAAFAEVVARCLSPALAARLETGPPARASKKFEHPGGKRRSRRTSGWSISDEDAQIFRPLGARTAF